MAEAQPAADRASERQLSEADLQHLVDKVYCLFQAELRLSVARGEPLPRRSARGGGGGC
jgi:hypothetical protein